MTKIPIRIVEKILLDIPKSSKVLRLCTETKLFFKIDFVVVSIPNNSMDYQHFEDMLLEQLDMPIWMFDYICGENGIK